jgi:hypothetical protein
MRNPKPQRTCLQISVIQFGARPCNTVYKFFNFSPVTGSKEDGNNFVMKSFIICTIY